MGKLIRQVEMKCDGDVFHEMFRNRPHITFPTSALSLYRVLICMEETGGLLALSSNGTISKIYGKQKYAKELVEAIDEVEKSIRYKVIEGDLMEQYKGFTFVGHVDTKGGNNLVTWTAEYEKQKADVPEPDALN